MYKPLASHDPKQCWIKSNLKFSTSRKEFNIGQSLLFWNVYNIWHLVGDCSCM